MRITAEKTKKNPKPILQRLFTLGSPHQPGSADQSAVLVILEANRVASQSDDLRDDALAEIVEYFEERVRDAVLNPASRQQFFKFNVYGAITWEASVEQTSERERLVNYYKYEPAKIRRSKEKKPPIQLQVIFTRGLKEPDADPAEGRALTIISRKRVSDGPDCPPYEQTPSPFVDDIEERVRFAVLNDDANQQPCKYHFDGSIDLQAIVEPISENERLVTYHKHWPSRRVQRRLAREAQVRRRSTHWQEMINA